MAEQADSAGTVLAVDGITVRFGGVTALADVSLQIQAGHGIDAIIGPNGAGKTTLFNVLTGVVAPTAGRIFLTGHAITGLRQDEVFRRGVSRTFQGVRLFEHLSVVQNVMLAARSTTGREARLQGNLTPGWLNAREGRARACQALDLVGLGAAGYDRLPAQLTLWESRMVEIARAISSEPAVLLLDEPAAGLNPVEKTRLSQLLRKLSAALACHLVVVEHDMNLVMSIAEKVWVLNFGRLLANGAPSAIQADRRVQEAYLGAPQEVSP